MVSSASTHSQVNWQVHLTLGSFGVINHCGLIVLDDSTWVQMSSDSSGGTKGQVFPLFS